MQLMHEHGGIEVISAPSLKEPPPQKAHCLSLRGLIWALERTVGYSETPREGLNGLTIWTWVLPLIGAPGPPTVNT